MAVIQSVVLQIEVNFVPEKQNNNNNNPVCNSLTPCLPLHRAETGHIVL